MPAFGLIKPAAAAAALVDPRSFATTLACVAHDEWGTAWLSWHPETVLMEVEQTWKVRLPPASYARLMAAALVLTADRFFKEVEAFRAVCSAFSGGNPSAELAEPLDSLECAWGITEALLLDPEAQDPEPFSEGVRRYIGVVLAHEGLESPPDVLRVAIMPPARRHPLPDDPGLRSAAYEVATLKSREITDSLRSGLSRLESQRAALGLPASAPTTAGSRR